ncbi:hypothetical protein C8R42DRAFT_373097 [Lentinula raphanica]|nr:hypothetical protein C8R42DRAFT_373097 [Lentinula raphanica]
MHFCVIHSLFAVVLLVVVSVTASPLPSDNRQPFQKREDSVPIYLGLCNGNGNDDANWLAKVSPEEIRSKAHFCFCISNYTDKCLNFHHLGTERKVVLVKGDYKTRPSRLDNCYEKLPLELYRGFKRSDPQKHFKVLEDVHELEERTGKVVVDGKTHLIASLWYLRLSNSLVNMPQQVFEAHLVTIEEYMDKLNPPKRESITLAEILNLT